MSVDRSEQRRRLFNLYSANIVLYAPEFANHFACPICGDIYGPDAVEGENPLVTIAHVYPKRCGGTVETLTCGRCNNQIGSKYDNQLTIEHRAHDAFRPGATRSLPGRMTFDGGDIGVRIKGAENSL